LTSGTADIPFRRFGRTDLQASAIGLGCARIGGIFKQDPNEFLNLLSVAFDAGINFYDTADIYSQGESERLLGRVFRDRRDRVVIASKAGFLLPAQRKLLARLKPFVRPLIGLIGLARHHVPAAVRGTLAQDFSPAHLQRSIEGSLKRLGTDHLDLFQLHAPPASIVQTTEWVAMLERIKQQGKIRYYGVSCDTLDAALAALEHPGVSALQLSISLLERRVVDALPQARSRGVAVIAREVLANGLLVKKASEIDVRSYCQSDEEAAAKDVLLNEYRQKAVARGLSLTQLALEYVTELDGVSVSLIGVSRLDQLNSLLSDLHDFNAPKPGIPHAEN
jgi:aryl-alcohol dehydrogenase-like predicted oxidoreductase